MLSRPCPPKLSYASITRIVLAAMLALALLAGIVPFKALSSDQTCTMECCAGKPPHLAGSCSAAFSGAHGEKTHGDADIEDHAHAGGMRMPDASPEIVEATSHCGTAQHSSEKDATARRASRPLANAIAHALTTPCSAECAAAAISAFAQVRRPREAAALPARNRPRPSPQASLAEHISNLQTSTAVIARQSRPRAPPLFL